MNNSKNVAYIVAVSFLAIKSFAAEPTNVERLQKANTLVISAFMINFELQQDANCKSKKYNDFDWNDWINNFPINSGSEKSKMDALKSLKETVEVMKKTKAPNSDKTISQFTYINMKDSLIKQNNQLGSRESYCDQVYSAAEGLFQKSKDNIKLLK